MLAYWVMMDPIFSLVRPADLKNGHLVSSLRLRGDAEPRADADGRRPRVLGGRRRGQPRAGKRPAGSTGRRKVRVRRKRR